MVSEIPTVKFYNGQQMPLVGLGTWMAVNGEELEAAVEEALKSGYRLFDTAFAYGNEAVIGKVIKRWLDEGRVTREELFIVAKLPPHGMNPTRVAHFLKKSLTNLQVDYVDLYLIHLPFACKYVEDDFANCPKTEDGKYVMDMESNLEEIWKAMEEQVDAGLTKSVGVSNFNCLQIERIISVARIKPANVQVEVSAYFQSKEIRKTCDKYAITVCGYSSLGSPGNKKAFSQMGLEFPYWDILEDPVVAEIAKAHNKEPAQILLKFIVQQNITVIPKSVSVQRIRTNIELFDFELADEEMEKLRKLDRGYKGRVCFRTSALNSGWDAHPEWPFPKDE